MFKLIRLYRLARQESKKELNALDTEIEILYNAYRATFDPITLSYCINFEENPKKHCIMRATIISLNTNMSDDYPVFPFQKTDEAHCGNYKQPCVNSKCHCFENYQKHITAKEKYLAALEKKTIFLKNRKNKTSVLSM